MNKWPTEFVWIIIILFFLFGCNNQKNVPTEESVMPTAEIPTSSSDFGPLSHEATLGRGTIFSAAISPDESKLAIVTSNGLWMYDANTLELIEFLDKSMIDGYSIIWSKSGEQIMVWNNQYYDWSAKIIDIETHQEITQISGDTLDAGYPSWSPKDPHIAFNSRDGSIHIWDVQLNQELVVLEAEGRVVYSPNGRYLATAGLGLVAVWDTTDWQTIYEFPFDLGGPGYNWIADLKWSPDGTQLAGIAGSSGHKWVWDVFEGVDKQLPDLGIVPETLAWSPDSTKLVFAGDEGMPVLDVASEEVASFLTSEIKRPIEIAWIRNQPHVLVVSSNDIELWDVESRELVNKVDEHLASGNISLEWSPDNKYIALADIGTLKIWEIANHKLALVIEDHVDENLFAWSSDGTRLAGWSYVEEWGEAQDGWSHITNRKLQVWHIPSGQVEYEGQAGRFVRSMQWPEDGLRMVVDENNELQVLESVDNFMPVELDGKDYSQAFISPNGQLLALGMEDGSIEIIELVSGEVLHRFESDFQSQEYLIWSPDSSLLASTGFAPTLQVWDVTSGEVKFRWESGDSSFPSISWSPDNGKIAAGFFEGQLIIFDSENGNQIGSIDIGTQIVDISWSPDGNRLAIADGAGFIQIWCIFNCE